MRSPPHQRLPEGPAETGGSPSGSSERDRVGVKNSFQQVDRPVALSRSLRLSGNKVAPIKTAARVRSAILRQRIGRCAAEVAINNAPLKRENLSARGVTGVRSDDSKHVASTVAIDRR